MEGHLKCSLEIPHSRKYREIEYKLSGQGGLGSPGSPSLFEASAVGVLSLHRLHLSRNCSIFRHCVDDVAFAGLSDVVCALHAASCCRCLLRSRWILVSVLQRCFGWKSRISSHLLCLLSCVIWMWNYSWFTDCKHCFIAELWRAKRACGAPWVSKSTHFRKFGNHVTVHRPPARPSAPQGNQCLILTLASQFGSTARLIFHTYIAHQCCDQLTAVKTGFPLTSITWPYRGPRCRPIEVEYLFEVIRWQVTSFHMIAGSSLFFFNSYEICCVLYVPHT